MSPNDTVEPSEGPGFATRGASERPAVMQLMHREGKGLMFSKELRFAGHVKRFLISGMGREGWEVREEQDERIVKQARYTDWHRVERALGMFTLEINELQDQGWVGA